MSSNQTDYETESFGKYFVDGAMTFGCNVFNRAMLSSHDNEDRCADDAAFDEFSRNTIAFKHE